MVSPFGECLCKMDGCMYHIPATSLVSIQKEMLGVLFFVIFVLIVHVYLSIPLFQCCVLTYVCSLCCHAQCKV